MNKIKPTKYMQHMKLINVAPSSKHRCNKVLPKHYSIFNRTVKRELSRYLEISREADHVHHLYSLLFIYLLVWIAGIVSITSTVFLLTKKSTFLISYLLLAIPLYFLYKLQKEFIKTRQRSEVVSSLIAVILLVTAFSAAWVPSKSYASGLTSSSVFNTPLSKIATSSTQAQSAIIPTPHPTPLPQPGTILYQEDGSNNWQGWGLSGSDWFVLDGKLLKTGGEDTSLLTAPYAPGIYGILNYAVEAKITLVRYSAPDVAGFGLVARATSDGGGYTFSNCIFGGSFNAAYEARLIIGQSFPDGNAISKTPFRPLMGVEYKYTLEVKGNRISVLVNDKTLITPVTEDTYLSGGQVSIWSSGSELSISSFEIIAL